MFLIKDALSALSILYTLFFLSEVYFERSTRPFLNLNNSVWFKSLFTTYCIISIIRTTYYNIVLILKICRCYNHSILLVLHTTIMVIVLIIKRRAIGTNRRYSRYERHRIIGDELSVREVSKILALRGFEDYSNHSNFYDEE